MVAGDRAKSEDSRSMQILRPINGPVKTAETGQTGAKHPAMM
jgi:hypothetical protein